jgi:hypothetical protein
MSSSVLSVWQRRYQTFKIEETKRSAHVEHERSAGAG